MKKIEVLGLQTIPEIEQGDNLAEIIVGASGEEIGGLQEKDILVLTSKSVSKAAGRVRKFDEVVPNKRALAISKGKREWLSAPMRVAEPFYTFWASPRLRLLPIEGNHDYPSGDPWLIVSSFTCTMSSQVVGTAQMVTHG